MSESPVPRVAPATDAPMSSGTNLCDPILDARGVKHAFATAFGWYDNGRTLHYTCFCGWGGRKTDFDAHYAEALAEPFSIDPETGYPAERVSP